MTPEEIAELLVTDVLCFQENNEPEEWLEEVFAERIEQAIQAEQERIAIMADDLADELDCIPCRVLAKAIRGKDNV